MKISQNGINLVKRFEGRRLTAYKPVAAVRVKQEDDEMVEKSKIITNGKEVPVKRILKDGVTLLLFVMWVKSLIVKYVIKEISQC